MSRTRALLAVLGAAACATAGAVTYAVVLVQGRAAGDLAAFDAERRPAGRVIVCAGASIVRGRASVDWVAMLRPTFPTAAVLNAGVNGNLAAELDARLGEVLRCQPDDVIILVGTNDAQAGLSPQAAVAVQKSKRLTEKPTITTYESHLRSVVSRLRAAGTRVALCSLPPLGQDLGAPENGLLRTYNAVIAQVAVEQGAAYLPVYEYIAAILKEAHSADGPAFTGSWWPGVGSLVRHFVAGTSYDRISADNGLLLSPDFVHLNTRGAQVVAHLAADFLSGADADPPSPTAEQRRR